MPLVCQEATTRFTTSHPLSVVPFQASTKTEPFDELNFPVCYSAWFKTPCGVSQNPRPGFLSASKAYSGVATFLAVGLGTRGRSVNTVTALPVFRLTNLRFRPNSLLRGTEDSPRYPLTCTLSAWSAPRTYALLFANFLSRVASGIMAARHVFTNSSFYPRHVLTHGGLFGPSRCLPFGFRKPHPKPFLPDQDDQLVSMPVDG